VITPLLPAKGSSPNWTDGYMTLKVYHFTFSGEHISYDETLPPIFCLIQLVVQKN
jgi:hypothetical protein